MSANSVPKARLRLLLMGNLDPFLTTGARLAAFRELGIEAEGLDLRPFSDRESRWMRGLTHFTLRTPAVYAFNRTLIDRFERFRPDILWLEKPTFVFPSTLRRLRRAPGVRFVYHNTDDWHAKDRLHALHWRYLLRGLCHFDLYVLSNLHNVRE